MNDPNRQRLVEMLRTGGRLATLSYEDIAYL
jgi:hypothetical protein